MKKCERGAVLRGEVPWGEIPWFHGAKVVAPERGMDKLGGGGVAVQDGWSCGRADYVVPSRFTSAMLIINHLTSQCLL